MPKKKKAATNKQQDDSTTTAASSSWQPEVSLAPLSPNVLAPQSPASSSTGLPLMPPGRVSWPATAPNLLGDDRLSSPRVSFPALSRYSPSASSGPAADLEEVKGAPRAALAEEDVDLSNWDEPAEGERQEEPTTSPDAAAPAEAEQHPWQLDLASWNTQGKPGFDIHRINDLMSTKQADVLVLSELKGKLNREESEDFQQYLALEEDERQDHRMHAIYGPVAKDYDVRDMDVSESGNRRNQEFIRAIARRKSGASIENARTEQVPGQYARPAAAFDVVKQGERVSVASVHAPYDKGSEAASNYMRSLMQSNPAQVLLGDTNVYNDGDQSAKAASSRRSSRNMGGSSVGGGVNGYQNVSGGMQTSRGGHSLDKVYADEDARSQFAFEVGPLAEQEQQGEATTPRKRRATTNTYKNGLQQNAPDHEPIRVTIKRQAPSAPSEQEEAQPADPQPSLEAQEQARPNKKKK